MIIDAVLFGLAFYLIFPCLNAYCAANYGRSFKVWFAIGMVLPGISFILLVFILVLDEKSASKRLSKREQMIANKMVGELISDSNISIKPKKSFKTNGFFESN